jgi:hypothetical protein
LQLIRLAVVDEALGPRDAIEKLGFAQRCDDGIPARTAPGSRRSRGEQPRRVPLEPRFNVGSLLVGAREADQRDAVREVIEDDPRARHDDHDLREYLVRRW